MGTGIINNLFSGTKGSRTNTVMQDTLFFDKATSNMEQKKSTVVQQGNSFGSNLDLHSGRYSQGNEMSEDEIDSIFQLFVALCDLLKSRLKKIKNKKLHEFLDDFDNNNTSNFHGFLVFKKYFSNKSVGSDYGYDIIINFISRYFIDSSEISMRLQRNEWITHVQKYKNRK
jgi:hypothetical protein